MVKKLKEFANFGGKKYKRHGSRYGTKADAIKKAKDLRKKGFNVVRDKSGEGHFLWTHKTSWTKPISKPKAKPKAKPKTKKEGIFKTGRLVFESDVESSYKWHKNVKNIRKNSQKWKDFHKNFESRLEKSSKYRYHKTVDGYDAVIRETRRLEKEGKNGIYTGVPVRRAAKGSGKQYSYEIYIKK